MLTVELPKDIEKALLKVSLEVGESVDHCVREAIQVYLEDIEDMRIANERLSNPAPRLYTSEDVDRMLDD